MNTKTPEVKKAWLNKDLLMKNLKVMARTSTKSFIIGRTSNQSYIAAMTQIWAIKKTYK